MLLPAAYETLAGPGTQRQAEQQPAQQQLSQLGSAARQVAAWALERRLPLWAGAVAVTGAGRVAADAHWCSDVLAGALLGIALTGLTVQLCAIVEGGALPLGLGQQRSGDRNKQKSERP